MWHFFTFLPTINPRACLPAAQKTTTIIRDRDSWGEGDARKTSTRKKKLRGEEKERRYRQKKKLLAKGCVLYGQKRVFCDDARLGTHALMRISQIGGGSEASANDWQLGPKNNTKQLQGLQTVLPDGKNTSRTSLARSLACLLPFLVYCSIRFFFPLLSIAFFLSLSLFSSLPAHATVPTATYNLAKLVV